MQPSNKLTLDNGDELEIKVNSLTVEEVRNIDSSTKEQEYDYVRRTTGIEQPEKLGILDWRRIWEKIAELIASPINPH